MSSASLRLAGIGDHPPEDTFVSLHSPKQDVRTASILDRSPTYQAMRNDGKPILDGVIASAVSREEARKRAALAVAPARTTGMKIYIAGPMTGIPHLNFPAFYAAQELLERHGHEVFNPAERDKVRHGGIDISIGNVTGSHEHAVANHGFSLREALNDDTHYICTTANCIAMLPGWEGSKGARAEHALAFALGHQILYLGPAYV